MDTSETTSVSVISELSSTKLWKTLGVVLFLLTFGLVAYQVYQSQPRSVLVSTKNLTPAEHHVLSKRLAGYQEGSFFSAGLPQLEEQVTTEDWVGQVNIEREWDKGIVVTALPRQPIARFGSDHLIDAQGTVFRPVDEAQLHQDGLIMLQGDEQQSYIIMQQMQQVNQWFAPLDIQVKDMVLTPRMTWLIMFDDGLRIIVDNEQTSQKLMNVSQLLQNQLTDKRADIASMDLRYKNGFAISWKDNRAAPIELLPISELYADEEAPISIE